MFCVRNRSRTRDILILKPLKSAIQSASIETTLELLTPADLDALRMNKGQQTRQINQERRYLLLVITDSTFNTRVHYPLSLNEEIQVSLYVFTKT